MVHPLSPTPQHPTTPHNTHKPSLSTDPFTLYSENSEEASLYRRMGRTGGALGVVGGVGGSSIRVVPITNGNGGGGGGSGDGGHFFSSHHRSVPLKDFRRAELYLYEKLGR